MIRRLFAVLKLVVVLAMSSSIFAAESSLTIKILYDNYVFDEACGPDWGFACLITGTEKNLLFDTGGKGDLLLANFEKMKLSPSDVELVVISHNHTDHTGGLLPFLAKNRNVAVFLPASTPESFVREAEAQAASVSVVTKPVEICKDVFVLGPMGDQIIEQALVVVTEERTDHRHRLFASGDGRHRQTGEGGTASGHLHGPRRDASASTLR